MLTRERYRLLAVAAFTDLSVLCEHASNVVGAEHYARQTLQLEPLAEYAHRQLLRLLSSQDRRNEALVHFSTFKSYLQDELGVAPEAETVALFQQIHNGNSLNAHLDTTAEPGAQTPALVANNLYSEATPFIGRGRQLEQLDRHL